MDAAVSEMAIKCGVVVVFVEQLADVAEVSAQFFRRDGGVVPSFPFGRRARGSGSGARTRLAQFPHVAGFTFRVQPDIGRIRRLFQLVDESSGEIVRLARIIRSKFHQQNASAFRNELQVRSFFLFYSVDDASFETLETD